MLTAVALVSDRAAKARIIGALRDRARVRFVAEAEELVRAVDRESASVVITDLLDHHGGSTAPVVRRIKTGTPSVAVICLCTPASEGASDILDVARAGVNALVFRGCDDGRVAFRAALDSAEDHCAAAGFLCELAPLPTPEALRIIGCCLEHAPQAPSVGELARKLGMPRRTLISRLKHLTMPPPQLILGWCRLVFAARYMEDPQRSVNRIALLLNFSSGAALRNMLKRYTGYRPHEVRERGGHAFVLRLFRQVLTARSADEGIARTGSPGFPLDIGARSADAKGPMGNR